MLLRVHLSLCISFIFLTCANCAGTPPRYPFDKPAFGEARCDNSLPNPPAEDPRIKAAAKEKLESTGGGSGGRPQPSIPIIPIDALESADLAAIVSSPDPTPDGVIPTSLFQYYEKPFLYQVYASEVTSRLVSTKDPTTIEKINDLASDVLRTCCQFGYSGTRFGKFSDTEGDYVEVYVSYWRTLPAGSTPLAVEGPFGVARTPSSYRNGQGRMVQSPSQENLLQGFPSGLTSPSGSTELCAVPEDSPSGSGRVRNPAEGSNAPNQPSQGQAPTANQPSCPSDAPQSCPPELQLLLRQCRDGIMQMNERLSTPENTDSTRVELRETWCKECCGLVNDHQGATGCCIMSMVAISTLFTVLNFFCK